MAEALIDMRSTNRIRPGSYNIQVFFLAKSDEIINVFRTCARDRTDSIASDLEAT